MTTFEEIDVSRLAEIAALPADSPERVAWDADVAQRMMLRTYLDFLEAEPAPGSKPEEAREQLTRFLHDAPLKNERKSARRPRLGSPAFRRTLIAAAAVVVIAVGVRMWTPDSMQPTGVQRGDAGGELVLETGRLIDGELDLRWKPMLGADHYVVILYRADLTEIRRLDPTDQITATVDLDFLGGEHAGETLVWRVAALSAGDIIGRSSVGYVTLP